MRYLVGIFSMMLMLHACTDPKMEKVSSLKKECIAIHDEVMPKMGEIVSLSGDIKDWKKTMDADTSDSIAAYRMMLVSHVQLLDSAHESMMDWMAEYDVDYETRNESDSAIAYYENEIVRITNVKTLMLKSIEDGKRVLEERD